MHYVERLVRRALAVPREQAPIPFDPFEQVAPWIHDPPGPSDVTLREATAAPLGTAPQAPPAAPQIQHAQADPLPPRVRETVPAARIEPSAVPTAAALPSAETIRAALQPAAPPAEHMRPALAQADAFMRSLAAKTAAIETPAISKRATAPPEAQSPLRGAIASPGEPVAPRPPDTPALVRPVPPQVRDPVAPRPARQHARRSPPTYESTPQASTPRRGAQPSAPGPAVQTTIVVVPPSRRLDDLAHSSGITRFGIGQS